jgi:hypothetical protein
MKHEVCITLALRSKTADPDNPAQVHYRQLEPGHRTTKFTQLGDIHLDTNDWQLCTHGWRDPFLLRRVTSGRPSSHSKMSSSTTALA